MLDIQTIGILTRLMKFSFLYLRGPRHNEEKTVSRLRRCLGLSTAEFCACLRSQRQKRHHTCKNCVCSTSWRRRAEKQENCLKFESTLISEHVASKRDATAPTQMKVRCIRLAHAQSRKPAFTSQRNRQSRRPTENKRTEACVSFSHPASVSRGQLHEAAPQLFGGDLGAAPRCSRATCNHTASSKTEQDSRSASSLNPSAKLDICDLIAEGRP